MTIVQALKNEIGRVAKKEINKSLAPIKRVNATQRSLIAKLRRDITDLQQTIKQLEKQVPAEEAAPVAAKAKAEDKRRGNWVTGKGIRSLRTKLGITQSDLAKLADVSDQTVVNWEKGDGKIAFRQQKTADRIQEIRKLRKKAAARELAALQG